MNIHNIGRWTSVLALTGAFLAVLVAATAGAQQPEPQMECQERRFGWLGGWFRGGRADACEVREWTLAAEGMLAVDARQNGSIRVTGSDRDDVLVRALVRTWDETDEDARELQRQVEVLTEGTIRAEGPEQSWRRGRRPSWSVSYEILTPRRSDLRLDAVNGGIVIEDVRGDIDFETTNGGVSVHGLAGDVRGRTTNGGIDATLTGDTWDGEGFDIRATNGGVRLRVPEGYSARLDAKTVNGGVNIDFPVTVRGRIGREVSTTLGDGGPLISVSTTNGGVNVSR